jgi:hypothetical protein
MIVLMDTNLNLVVIGVFLSAGVIKGISGMGLPTFYGIAQFIHVASESCNFDGGAITPHKHCTVYGNALALVI